MLFKNSMFLGMLSIISITTTAFADGGCSTDNMTKWFQTLSQVHAIALNVYKGKNVEVNLAKFSSQALNTLPGGFADQIADNYGWVVPQNNLAAGPTVYDYMDNNDPWITAFALDAFTLNGQIDSAPSTVLAAEKTSEVFRDPAIRDSFVLHIRSTYPAQDFNLDALQAAFLEDVSPDSSATFRDTVQKLIPQARWSN